MCSSCTFEKLMAWLNMICGVILVVLGVVAVIQSIINPTFVGIVFGVYTTIFGLLLVLSIGFGYSSVYEWFGLLKSWLGLFFYTLFFGLLWVGSGDPFRAVLAAFIILVSILDLLVYLIRRDTPVPTGPLISRGAAAPAAAGRV